MTARHNHIGMLILLLLGISCNLSPKESEPFPYRGPLAQISLEGLSNSIHEVVIEDILPADNYLYLQVREDEKLFWIASRKQPVAKGQTYFYNESLLKTNFKSKEHARVFDTLYLVTRLIDEASIQDIHLKGNTVP